MKRDRQRPWLDSASRSWTLARAMFRAPGQGSYATGANSLGGLPQEPPVTLGKTRRKESLLIDFYRLLLFVVILGYYSTLVVATIKLIQWAVALVDERVLSGPIGMAIYAIYLALAMPLCVQMVWLLVKGMVGLVTTLHDESSDVVDGLLLDRDEHPELYDKVAEVARRVDAPAPDEIRIACGGDCYVTERRRFSIATDRKLVLVLGLPHLCVLTVTELKVILAHELAHFRRGDTSLGVFVYRFLESLRLTIDKLARSPLCWINPLYYFCRLYFHVFMRLSAPIRRQQELRADCFSAAAYGGELAARTLIKEWLVAHRFDAFAASYDEEASRHGNGRPQNVFRWFARSWRELSTEGQAYLEGRLIEEETASFWDSYPAMHVRLATMRGFEENLMGREPGPARELLRDFAEIEQRLHEELFGAFRTPSRSSFSSRQERRGNLIRELAVRPPFGYRNGRRWGSRPLRQGEWPRYSAANRWI
ncbi:MAG: M48 family metalloprotease [Pirellulales bacterium]|nr:M48 family metalloprotease [Pirellulales bacterium]